MWTRTAPWVLSAVLSGSLISAGCQKDPPRGSDPLQIGDKSQGLPAADDQHASQLTVPQPRPALQPTAERLPAGSHQKPLRLGLAIPSYVHAVAWVGAERGAFADEGVALQISVTGGSAAAMRTLIGGGIDVALAGGDAVLRANSAGADLVVLGSLVGRFYHRLVARKEIAEPADLRGRKIGLPFLGGPQDVAVRYALDKFQLRYGQDVEIASLGKQFNQLAALTRGDIHATTSDSPDSQLQALGLHVLLDLPKEPVAFPYLVLSTRRPTLADRRPELLRLMRGLCRAILDYQSVLSNGPQHAEIAAILQSRLHEEDPQKLKERLETFGPALLAFPPRIDAAAFEQLLRFGQSGAAGDTLPSRLSPETLFDSELLREAEGPCVPHAKAEPPAKPWSPPTRP